MQFWQKLGELSIRASSVVLKEVIHQDNIASERSKKHREEIPSKSDDELLDIIKGDIRKAQIREQAARCELKNRGYNDDIINLLIRS